MGKPATLHKATPGILPSYESLERNQKSNKRERGRAIEFPIMTPPSSAHSTINRDAHSIPGGNEKCLANIYKSESFPRIARYRLRVLRGTQETPGLSPVELSFSISYRAFSPRERATSCRYIALGVGR